MPHCNWKNNTVNLEHLFYFELSPFPAALARFQTEIHFPDRPKLVKCLRKFISLPNTVITSEAQYILDGGKLISKMVNWKKTNLLSANC